MLKPLDCYPLARHLWDLGEPLPGIADMLTQYVHATWLLDNFPIPLGSIIQFFLDSGYKIAIKFNNKAG